MRVRNHSQPRGSVHEPHDPVMQRRRHPKKPRTLTGTSTVTSCLHFPGLVTVWACLTHPLWLGSTSAPPEATTVLFRPTHMLLGHSKTPAGLPPSCCNAGNASEKDHAVLLGEGGEGHDSCLCFPLPCGLPGCSEAAPPAENHQQGKCRQGPSCCALGALPAPRRLWVTRGQFPLSTALRRRLHPPLRLR